MSQLTRTEDITRVLREEVLRGQYRPGERLPSERDLASRFGTTRGVARVALKKLEQLGMAAVEPGGSRVQPVSEASLDVIAHLLELQRPPDPILVDQVLEVMGALVSATARMAVERGRPEELARVAALVELLRKPEDEALDHHRVVHDLAHAFFNANDNVVMKIVRRTLRSEVFGKLQELSADLEALHVEQVRRAISRRFAGSVHVEALAIAVEARDGLAVYESVHQIWGDFRRSVVEVLEQARGGLPSGVRLP